MKPLIVVVIGSLIVIIVMLGWERHNTIPFYPNAVENGVALVAVCGKAVEKDPMGNGFDRATSVAPRPRTGIWSPLRRGDCVVWYHAPAGLD